MRELIDTLITEYQLRPLSPKSLDPRIESIGKRGGRYRLLTITGMRGTGKTTGLLAHADELVAAGVPKERTLYFDFADLRLASFKDHDVFACMIDAFMQRFPENRHATTYLLLDNIGHVREWQKFARSLIDTYDTHLVAADACQTWLSEDHASEMPRESIIQELLPLGFSELAYPNNDMEAAHRTLEKNYLHRGGLPQALAASEFEWPRLLQSTLRKAVTDDLLRLNPHLNASMLLKFAVYALGKSGNRLSLAKAQRCLKEQGISTTRSTLQSYLTHLEQAHLLYTVSDFRFADAANPRSARTVIAGDHGLACAVSPSKKTDAAGAAATLAYLDLRRKEHLGDVHCFYMGKGAIPAFVCGNAKQGKAFSLVGVCSGKPNETDIGNLQAACAQLDLRKALLLASEEEAPRKENGKTVEIIALREWLSAKNHL